MTEEVDAGVDKSTPVRVSKIKFTERQKEARRLLSNPDHNTILLHGGSRSGKSFIACHAIAIRAVKAPGSRHLIARFRHRDVKNSIGRDTLPTVLRSNRLPYTLDKTDWFFTLPNGSEIWLGGLDDQERVEKILGMEYSTIYFNESSQISYHSYSTALTRLAQKNELIKRVIVDCNPPTRSHWLYKLFFDRVDPETRVAVPNPMAYAELSMNPIHNVENLPEGYIEERLSNLPERKKLRFRDGAWLDDPAGALWREELINSSRHIGSLPILKRVVVGVDPAVTGNPDSDETGIVVAGQGGDGEYYVLADMSLRGSPYDWAVRTNYAFEKYGADRVIGEVNNGGDLVEVNIRTVNRKIPYSKVYASRGKYIRAEPIAGLYEQGLVHHCGMFSELEQQMCEWTPGEKSPDRMDALVWALTELSGGNEPLKVRARGGKRR